MRLAFLTLKYLIGKMKHEKGKLLNIWTANIENLNIVLFEPIYCGAY